MKILLLTLMVLHGLIHLLGFAKAFNLASVSQLSQNISKINGILWLDACLLFIAAAFFFFIKKEWWRIFAVSAIIISQYLIIISWHDAKFGTIANVIILIATIIGTEEQ